MRAGFDLCSDVAAHTKGSWDVSVPTPVCVTSACGSCTCRGWQEAGRSHCWASAVLSQSPWGARQQVLPVALTGRSQICDSTARSVTREAERSVLEQKERRLGQGDGSRRGDFKVAVQCASWELPRRTLPSAHGRQHTSRLGTSAGRGWLGLRGFKRCSTWHLAAGLPGQCPPPEAVPPGSPSPAETPEPWPWMGT